LDGIVEILYLCLYIIVGINKKAYKKNKKENRNSVLAQRNPKCSLNKIGYLLRVAIFLISLSGLLTNNTIYFSLGDWDCCRGVSSGRRVVVVAGMRQRRH